MTKADKEGQRKTPILRFKGFTDDWEQRELNEVTTRVLRKNKNLISKRPLTISAQYGLIDQQAFFNKQVASSNLENYLLLEKGEFAYNKSYSDGFPYGTIKKLNLYGNGAVSTLYIAFKANADINSDFLENLFSSNKWHNEVYKIAAEGARNHGLLNISPDDFFNIKITISKDSQEQSFISKFLRIFDNLLALYAKKSSCLDSCIAYFIRTFYDYQQFFKQKNVQSSIVKSFKLNDILIKNNIRNKDSSILNVESISNKEGFISQKKQFDNYQVASKDLSNYYVIHPKDFAYNPSRINVGSIAYKNPNDVKGIVSPLYVSFKCKNDIILDKYLWYWFKSANFEHQRVRLSEGGVRDTLSFNQLSKMKISIPSFEIQKQTIKFLEILIQYKEEIDLKLNNLKLIKNTLLQNMFL